ncbi:MAG: hypothetical protein AAFQ78_00210 [Bacteroidota bacterium]
MAKLRKRRNNVNIAGAKREKHKNRVYALCVKIAVPHQYRMEYYEHYATGPPRLLQRDLYKLPP